MRGSNTSRLSRMTLGATLLMTAATWDGQPRSENRLAYGMTSAYRAQPLSKESGENQASPFISEASAFSLGDSPLTRPINFETFPVRPVMDRARTVAERLQPSPSNRIHVVHVYRKEPSPLLAVTEAKGMCIVVLNKNADGWAVWERFLDNLPDAAQMDVVEVAVAHEIGHCMERQLQMTANGEQAIAANKSGNTNLASETYADIFATAYAMIYMRERATTPLERLIKSRKNYSWFEPAHATAQPLAKAWKKMRDMELPSGSGGNPHDLISRLDD